MMENIGEKNPSGPTNIYPPDLGGKVGRKERKVGLSTWITYLPPWYVICKFFLFFILFILLWELACFGLVSQILDSLSFLPFFFFFFFFFKFLFFCVHKTPFLFSNFFFFFGFLNFLSSLYFILFYEEIIHTYFF